MQCPNAVLRRKGQLWRSCEEEAPKRFVFWLHFVRAEHACRIGDFTYAKLLEEPTNGLREGGGPLPQNQIFT